MVWYFLDNGNSNIFYFHPYLGKIPNLTHIFQRGWNHQLVLYYVELFSWGGEIILLGTDSHGILNLYEQGVAGIFTMFTSQNNGAY